MPQGKSLAGGLQSGCTVNLIGAQYKLWDMHFEMFGGKSMDTFIDKLAQRLTAQEMIKANSAADAQELHKVQGQVKQYEAYLDELQNISSAVVTAVNKLEHAGETSAEMADRLEHASVASAAMLERLEGAIESALQAINRMEQMREISTELTELADKLEHAGVASAAASERIDQVVNTGIEQLEHAGVVSAAASEKIDRVVSAGIEKLQHAEVNTDGINELVETSIIKIREVQQDNDNIQTLLRDSVSSQNETINDFVHKENVKVYRNVQAVVVEEAAKQTENLEKISKTGAGKMGAILGISAVALVASLGSLIFQILSYLHVI